MPDTPWLQQGSPGGKAVGHIPAVENGFLYLKNFKRWGLVAVSFIVFSATAYANPVLNQIESGQVSVQQTATTTTVNQTSDKGIIDWHSFNIGTNETTRFNQPSSSSVTLNRIDPNQGASQIFGQLSANGHLVLVNQAGMFFGPSARVDVAGLIASTANISNTNFLAGNFKFDQASGLSSSIINQGTIVAAQNGLVALIGNNVENDGTINATLGNVVLASGSTFTLDLTGDQLVNFAVTGVDENTGNVTNAGAIAADGGTVRMSAEAAAGVVNNVINMSGIVEARSVSTQNGAIILSGGSNGSVHVSGTLDASGKNTGESGGRIDITGDQLVIDSTASLDVSGAVNGGHIRLFGDTTAAHGSFYGTADTGSGGFIETSGHSLDISGIHIDTHSQSGMNGTWLLDPYDVTISSANTANETLSSNTYTPSATGANILNTDLQTALQSNNITITTGNSGSETGNITLNSGAAISWDSTNTLTLDTSGSTGGSIALNSTITNTNNGGLTLKSGSSSGTISLNSAINLNSGTLTLTSAGAVTQSAVIGGGAAVVINGTGSTTLSQANTYTGITSVSTGTLNISAENNLGSTPAAFTAGELTLASGATLNVSGTFSLNATRGLSFSSNNSTIDVTSGHTFTVSGVVSGAGSFTKTDTGTLTLSANNTFSGGTTVTGGTLSLTHPNALGTSGAISVGTAATLTLNLSGGTLANTSSLILSGNAQLIDTTATSSTDTLTNAITIAVLGTPTVTSTNAGATLVFKTGNITHNGVTLTFTGAGNAAVDTSVISGFGSLDQTGTGTLTLLSANTYIGNTVITNGKIKLGTANGLPTTGSLTIGGSGTFDMAGFSQAVTDLYGSGVLTDSTTAASFSTSSTDSNSSFSGTISGALNFIKGGSATLALSGHNTYTGGTTLNAGVLWVTQTDALGLSGAIVINGGSLAIDLGGNTLANTSGITINGAGVSNAGSIVGLGIGVTDTLTNLITLGSNSSLGVYYLGSGLAFTNTGTITGSGFNLTLVGAGEGSIASNISTGTGTVTMSGADTWTLSGNNSYTGATTVSTGTLSIDNVNALGSSATQTANSASVSVTTGAALRMNFSGTLTNTNAITLNGTGISSAGALTSNTSTATLSNNIILAGNTAVGGSADMILNGNISQSSTGFTFTKTGSGTLTLGGSNSYTGATTVSAGRLTLTNINALGSSATQTANSASTSVATGAELRMNFSGTLTNTNVITLNDTGISSGGALTSTTSTATLGNNITLASNTSVGGTANMVLNGIISDGGSAFAFTKVGAGTLTLGGAATYTGGTIVSNGTLKLGLANGLTSTGALTIGASGTFDLAGFAQTVASLNGSGILTDSGTAAVFTGNDSSQLDLFSGSITGSLSLNETGTGILTLSGVNTYTGGTTVSSGTLSVLSAQGLGTAGAILVDTGATLAFSLGGRTLTNTSGITVNGTGINGTGSLYETGVSGTDTLTNLITLGSNSTIGVNNGAGFALTNSGTITGSGFNLTLAGAGDGSIASIIGTGTGTLTVNAGGGSWTLSGNNTYTGITTVSAGTLSLTNVNALGSSITQAANSASVTVSTDAALRLNFTGTLTNTNPITLNGIGINSTGALYNGSGNATLTNTITLNTSALIGVNTGSTFSLTSAGTLSGSGKHLTLVGGGNGSITSVIGTGTGALTVNASGGTWTLSGNNTYTGITTISAGTLSLTNVNALGSSATQSANSAGVAITSGAELSLNFTGTLQNTNGITLNGSGISSVGALYDASGNVTLGNLISLGSNSSIGANTGTTLTLTNAGTLTGFNYGITLVGGGSGSLASIIGTGPGSLTMNSTGTWTLSGINTYTGITALNAGTLSVSSAENLGGNPDVATPAQLTLNGGTLATTASFNLNHSRSGITLGTNGGVIDVASGTTLTVLNTITGTGGLEKVDTGTLLFTSANTYSGGTTVTNGILQLGIANGAPSTGALTVAASGTFEMAGFAQTVASLNGSGVLTDSNASAVFTANDTASDTFSGAITGTLSLVKGSTGTLTLSGDNTYTGATTVSAGTLQLSNVNALGSSGTQTSNSVSTAITAGAELRMNFAGTLTNTNVMTLNGTGISNTGALTSTTSTATLNNNLTLASDTAIGGPADMTLTGIMSGAHALTKVGNDTLTLTGSNTFTGATAVSAGILLLNNANALGSSVTQTANSASIAVTAGAELGMNFAGTLTNTNAMTLNGTGISSAGALTSATSAATLSNNITLATDTSIGGSADMILNGIISDNGASALTKVGSASLTLGGSDTYNGLTTVSDGTLILTNINALGASIGTTVTSGTELRMNFSGTLANSSLMTLSGSGISNAGALTSVTSTATLNNNITLAADTTVGGSANMILNGVIDDSSLGFALTKVGSGTLTLDAANTYTGLTTVSNGTLQLGIDSGLISTGALLINASGTFNMAGFAQTVADLNGAGVLTDSGTTADFTDNNSASDTFSGAVTGTLNLVKTNSGTLTLSGNNTYSGITTVSAGTLQLNTVNALGSSAGTSVTDGAELNMNFAGTLTNTHTITLNGTDISNDGALTSSTSSAILSNSVTLASDTAIGGTANMTLNGVISGAYALTKVGSGTLTLGASNTYTGGTTVSDGTLSIANTAGLGIPIGADLGTVESGATLDLNFNGTLGHADKTIVLNGTGVGSNGAFTLSGTSMTVNNPIVLASISSMGGSGTGTMVLGGSISDNAAGYGLTIDLSAAGLSLPTLTLGDAGSLSVTTHGSITQTGIFTLTNSAVFSAVGGAIALTQNNSFGSDVSLSNTGLNNISVTTTGALTLGTVSMTSSTGGGFTASSTGAITQSGSTTITTGTGNVIFNSGLIGAPITLTNANAIHGKISLLITGSDDISLVNDADTLLGSGAYGTNLTVQSTGRITLSSAITVTGDITLAGGAFTNNAGSKALKTGKGHRYLIWSGNPGNDSTGGLATTFIQYNAIYGSTAPVDSNVTHSGFLYSFAPILTPVLSGTVRKVYNASAAATLAAHNYSLSGVINGDTVTFTKPVNGRYATPNVGTGINVSVTGISILSTKHGKIPVYGYTLADSSANANIGVITPASITITPNLAFKLYGQNDPAFSYKITAGHIQGHDQITGAMVRVNYGLLAGEQVGHYGIRQGTLTAGSNYILTFVNSANLTINKNILRVTANSFSKIYGTNDPTLTYSVSGLVSGTVDGVSIHDIMSGNIGRAKQNTLAGEQAGTYIIGRGSLTHSTNYVPMIFTGGYLTIQKALVSVTADAISKIFGSVDPTLTYSSSGLVNATVDGVLIQDTFKGTLIRKGAGTVAGEQVGVYPILKGTLNAGRNYNVNFTGADFTIDTGP